MRWTKRTAPLLASLLVLTTIAQAQEPAKAHARDERNTPSYTSDAAKMPELVVVTPQASAPNSKEPERTEYPELPVITLETREANSSQGSEQPSAAPEAKEADGPQFPEAEDWQLLLVNPWNEIPEDYEVTLKTLSDGQKVDERAYDDLNAMLKACRDAGLHPKICSAYRTMAKQTYLYNNKIKRLRNAGYSRAAAEKEAGRWVARPGTSEHQLGLALDIVSQSYQALTKKQEKTKEQKWLMEHCWEYGFILRYPSDKGDITGIGYEPWHYRYVGREVALDIQKSGLCMEEYLLAREEALKSEI